MLPKKSRKRKISVSNHVNAANIIDSRSKASKIEYFSLDDDNLFRDYLLYNELNPLLEKEEKSYLKQIDFSQNLIEIKKVLMMSNPLSSSRFGETKESKLLT